MISWCDGLVDGPDGTYRQVPQHATWSSALFVTQDGTMRTRQYNPVTRSWSWGEELPLTFEGHRVGVVTKDGWKSVDRVIAYAWLHRAPGGSHALREKVLVHFADGSDAESSVAPRAESLEWVDGEVPDDRPIRGEVWKPLRWRCGVVPCDSRYQISNHGRLKSPFTGVTSGHWWGGTRWAAVRGGLLVDLLAAAGIQGVPIPPAIRLARDALLSGYAPRDLAGAVGIAESTAWKNTCVAAQHAHDVDQLRRRVSALVGQRLWRALVTLQGRPVLGASLTELSATLAKRDEGLVNVDTSALRLARLAVVARAT